MEMQSQIFFVVMVKLKPLIEKDSVLVYMESFQMGIKSICVKAWKEKFLKVIVLRITVKIKSAVLDVCLLNIQCGINELMVKKERNGVSIKED